MEQTRGRTVAVLCYNKGEFVNWCRRRGFPVPRSKYMVTEDGEGNRYWYWKLGTMFSAVLDTVIRLDPEIVILPGALVLMPDSLMKAITEHRREGWREAKETDLSSVFPETYEMRRRKLFALVFRSYHRH